MPALGLTLEAFMTLVYLLLRFFAQSVSSIACSESPEASHLSLSSELSAFCKLWLASEGRVKSSHSEMLASWLLGNDTHEQGHPVVKQCRRADGIIPVWLKA